MFLYTFGVKMSSRRTSKGRRCTTLSSPSVPCGVRLVVASCLVVLFMAANSLLFVKSFVFSVTLVIFPVILGVALLIMTSVVLVSVAKSERLRGTVVAVLGTKERKLRKRKQIPANFSKTHI